MKWLLLSLTLFSCSTPPPPPCGTCSPVTIGGSMVVACHCGK